MAIKKETIEEKIGNLLLQGFSEKTDEMIKKMPKGFLDSRKEIVKRYFESFNLKMTKNELLAFKSGMMLAIGSLRIREQTPEVLEMLNFVLAVESIIKGL